jgi:carbon storage regulator
MLVLSRKIGESIMITPHIRVEVVQVTGGRVRLGIVAPDTVPVHREEVFRRIEEEGHAKAQQTILGASEALSHIWTIDGERMGA